MGTHRRGDGVAVKSRGAIVGGEGWVRVHLATEEGLSPREARRDTERAWLQCQLSPDLRDGLGSTLAFWDLSFSMCTMGPGKLTAQSSN